MNAQVPACVLSRRAMHLLALSTCIACAFVLSPNAVALSLDDLPTFSDSKLATSERLSSEHLTAEYRVALPEGIAHTEAGAHGRNVAEACREAMRASGWELVGENRQRQGGEYLFRRDGIKTAKLAVAPAAKPIGGELVRFVAIRVEMRLLVPLQDNVGRDPVDVPRYPGSVRVRWMDLLGDYAVKYLVVAPLEDVQRFYETEPQKHGWVASSGPGDVNYQKAGLTGQAAATVSQAGPGTPMERTARAIPSTLAIHVDERDSIVHIGIGRAAGAGDRDLQTQGVLTPEPPPAPDPNVARNDLLISLNPELDLPVYDGLELQASWPEPVTPAGEEITRLQYTKQNAPMEDALAAARFYLDKMPALDWALEDDEWYGLGRTLLFRKGAVTVEVAIKAVGALPIPDNARAITIPVEVHVTEPMPSEEVIGEDLENVPRYPGSRRFFYLKAGIDHIVKFKAVASVAEAEWFFVRQLPEAGWVFAGNDTTGLLFVPAGTAASAAGALATGKLIPTTLKVKVDDALNGTVRIGMDLTKGD